jgi:AhpD family alkylhydroperoxidase
MISKGMKALIGVESYLGNTNLDTKIMELVKLRAYQINGCAYCVDMHYGELTKLGYPMNSLILLWRGESHCVFRVKNAPLLSGPNQ